ncbi:MAG: sigma-70 family RNA polymerase sigma factor [Deltaproteobacteria bacterium]
MANPRPTAPDVQRPQQKLELAKPAEPNGGTTSGVEDVALVERIAGGDDAAFEQLVERYQHRIFSFCARMLQDRQEAEDVAQDVFITLYKNAGEFRGESQFSTWLFRIAKNQTLNRIKYLERRGRSKKRSVDELADDGPGALADPQDVPADDRIADAQRAALVQEAIGTLAEDHRAVVVLRDMEDLSYEEISEITGLPIGTVKSRIHRGRSALARRLKRIFG